MQKKRKRMGSKILLGILIIFILRTIVSCIIPNRGINIRALNKILYIETADEVSKDKLQVNWKYLAAIDAVIYKNDFSKSNYRNIKILANKFIVEENKSTGKSRFRLQSLPKVMESLNFSKNDKEKVYTYLEDLKSIGMYKNNINSNNQMFIDGLNNEATNIYNKYGIFPSITMAQAILESGWGKSELSVKANNLFGIKADRSWKGKQIKMDTSENYSDKIKANFRVYSSKDESMKDYGRFLNKNQRYKENGVFKATHYIEQAKAIERAGYSTKEDENGKKIYADLLIKIIRENNLQLYDNKVQMKED